MNPSAPQTIPPDGIDEGPPPKAGLFVSPAKKRPQEKALFVMKIAAFVEFIFDTSRGCLFLRPLR